MSDAAVVVIDAQGGDAPQGAFQTAGLDILDDAASLELTSYLDTVIKEELDSDSRKVFNNDLDTYRRHREMKPKDKTKSSPWPNASNVVTSRTSTNTFSMFARAKTQIQTKDPRFTVTAMDASQQKIADSIQELIRRFNKSPVHVNLQSLDEVIIYEVCSLGTQVVEVPWTSEQRKFKTLGQNQVTKQVDKTVFEGPKPHVFELQKLLFPTIWTDLQTMPWVGIPYSFTKVQLHQQAQIGFFTNVDKVEVDQQKERTESDLRKDEREGLTADLTKKGYEIYDVYKTYVYWDADGDGVEEDFIVWFHPLSKTIMRIEYNYLGVRPIVPIRFLRMPFQFYGTGIGKLSFMGQETLDTLTNMRLDNLHLSSIPMLAVRQGSGLRSGEIWSPGKMLPTSDPTNDYREFKFPDTSGPTLNAEAVAASDLDRAVASNDISLGMSDQTAKTRVTTSGQMLISQKSKDLYSAILGGLEQGYSQIYQFQMMQFVLNSDRAKAIIPTLFGQLPEDQAHVQNLQTFLSTPIEDLPFKYAFSIESTKDDETKEAKRNMIVMIHQLFSGFVQEVLQLMGLLQQPEVTPQMKGFVIRALDTKFRLMEQAFALMNEKDGKEMVGYHADYNALATMYEQMRAAQLNQMKGQIGGQPNGQVAIAVGEGNSLAAAGGQVPVDQQGGQVPPSEPVAVQGTPGVPQNIAG